MNFFETCNSPKYVALCRRMRTREPQATEIRSLIAACADADVLRWFIPTQYGGWGFDRVEILRGYLDLSQNCLSTTFVLTQMQSACKRLIACDNEELKGLLLPAVANGKCVPTVGISHLSTSRQHLLRPVLTAKQIEGGYELHGYAPWVTASTFADEVVVGATVAKADTDAKPSPEILVVVPRNTAGLVISPPVELIGLTASCTGKIRFENVVVPERRLIAGPQIGVMNQGSGGVAGGQPTSALALGLAKSAIEFVRKESARRGELQPIVDQLENQWGSAVKQLLAQGGDGPSVDASQLRQTANSLVLRTTQIAMASAKGAGFTAGHPVGRWCREALFFLVWSCPPAVAAANVCELAEP